MIIRKRNSSNRVSTKSKDDGVEVKKVKYEKLTPVILDEDISNYEEPLDFAFSESDLLNIALSGPYGAGKSSIWKTYEENKGIRDSTIHISLADFNDMEGSDNNKEKSNKEEVNENEHYKEGSSGNIENSEINKIEFQILNQILYQIDEKNAPSAKYKVKREKSMGAKIGTFTLLSMFILGIIFLFFEHQIKSISRNPLKSFNINFWWLLLTILFLSIPAIFALGRYLNKQLNYFSLSKVGFHNSKIEFDSDNSESLFDRERDEIVYIIRESGISTIVFEDLDRFDNIEIFTKLRHINDLVNINRKDEKKIRFVYMLRDGIFSSRERVKFFDFIIPIVPVIDSSNAKGKFVKMFQEELEGEYSLEKKMLDRISIYVDDMRLLKNIYNEYIIYSNTIDAKGRQLDPNKLLGIITYKNVFPLDYENLQQNKGYVHKLFNEYKKRIDSITDDISEEISQLNDEITDLKNMAEEDYPSLLAAYFPTDRFYQEARKHDTLKEFTKYLLENPEEEYGQRESGLSILERIEKKSGFEEKGKLLENSKNKTHAIKERETKVRQLGYDMRRINGMMVKELLGEYIDYSIFDDVDGKIKEDHYFPLIKFLIVNGYIDETYKEYLSYFHEGSITADDQIFLRSIYEGRTLGYDYELDDALEVLDNLDASDFTRDGVLNFHLLKAIVSEKKDDFLEQLLENVNRSRSMDFLNGYITVSSDKNRIAFIKKQIEYDRNSLKRWLYAEDVDDKNRFFVIHTVLKMPRDELHYINEINGLDEYMESNSNILDYYNNNDDIKEVVDGMVELDIKFYDLGSSNSAYNVLIEIEGNDLYNLNPSNVNFIINGLLYSGDKEHSDIMAEQLTLVNSNSELENMRKHIEDNFVDYIELYIDSLDEGIKLKNSEEDTLLILNSDVDIDIIRKFIEYNETIITNINDINDKKLWEQSMERNMVSKTHYNAQEYYLEKGIIDEVLLKFINSFEDNSIYEWKSNPNRNDEFEIDLINTKNVNISIIEALIEDIDGIIVEINPELSETHLEVLLENQKINMNEENLLTFNHQYKSYFIDFITINISAYIDILDEIEEDNYETFFSKELVYQLLNSSAIQNSNKIMLIQKFGEDLKISKLVKADKEIRDEIARTKFDVTDMTKLVKLYEDLNIKSEVQNLMVEYFEYIDFDEDWISFPFIEDSIANENLGLREKTTLISLGIDKDATVAQIKNWLASIPAMEDIYSVFDERNPLLYDDEDQYEIALKLEEQKIISLHEDGNGYRAYILKKGRKG